MVSLVIGSVSENNYEPRLVDSLGFLVMSFISLAPIILPPSLLQDFLNSVNAWVYVCICFQHLLDEACLVTGGLGTNL